MPVLALRDAAALLVDLQQLVAGSGGRVGVTVVGLGGRDQLAWSVDGDAVFTAASTYKLVTLMMEAQSIAAGATDPNGLVCYIPSDYEEGCLTITRLAHVSRATSSLRGPRRSPTTRPAPSCFAILAPPPPPTHPPPPPAPPPPPSST